MKNQGLTAKQVEHMKPNPARRIEVAAGPPTGLYLIVQPSGAKSWAMRYRRNGKTQKLTFTTTFPDLKLAAARAEAEAVLQNLKDGIDPKHTQKVEVETEEKPLTAVDTVLTEYIKREVRIGDDERWKREIERILKRETKPWRNRSISEIGKPDVLQVLDAIVDRDASVMACRTRGALLRFFDWVKERGYIQQSPMFEVGKPGPDHESRDRVLKPSELAEIWSVTEGLGYPIGSFTRLLILCAQRRGEVASMRWRDVDLDNAVWTLPKEKTKPRRVSDVPLSTAAVELLSSLKRFKGGDYIFTTTSGEKAINGFSKAKESIDTETLKRRKENGIDKNIPDWCMHDFRRSAATHMAKAGVPPHILSGILNHSTGSTQGVTAIYNRFQYAEERRAALQAWSDFVLSLTTKNERKAATA